MATKCSAIILLDIARAEPFCCVCRICINDLVGQRQNRSQCVHAYRCTIPVTSRWRYSVVAITTDSDSSHLLSVNPGSNPGSAFPFASTAASFETQVPFLRATIMNRSHGELQKPHDVGGYLTYLTSDPLSLLSNARTTATRIPRLSSKRLE